jgi:hypothetical protein
MQENCLRNFTELLMSYQRNTHTGHLNSPQASEERSRAGGDVERQSMLADKLSFHTEAAKAVMMANMQVLPHPGT